MPSLQDIIDTDRNPLADSEFRNLCKEQLDREGALVLTPFLTPEAIEKIVREGEQQQHLAYYCQQQHNVYLTPEDENYPSDHPRNRRVDSSKGCITDDQIPSDSPLHTLYDDIGFRDFLCYVLGEEAIYDYADPLSSINLHYAGPGQELGWHFDNSSFAITLLIQKPERGGDFEYVKNARDADAGEMKFDMVESVLDGKQAVTTMDIPAGALAMFRGRNALHRVTPVEGDTTRMLVVLAYNSAPGIALSESARMTFYGRLGE